MLLVLFVAFEAWMYYVLVCDHRSAVSRATADIPAWMAPKVMVLPHRQRGKVPHTIFFTHKVDFLEDARDGDEWELLRKNVRNTVQVYSRLWGEPVVYNHSSRPSSNDTWDAESQSKETVVRFLTNDDCRRYIAEADQRLVPHFDRESSGKYKADICRIAALYMDGGYYFDTDIRALKPVNLDKKELANISFSTVVDPDKKAFFQAFMASAPRHPILRKTMSKMVKSYEMGGADLQGRWMGPATLWDAVMSMKKKKRGHNLLLQEGRLFDYRFQGRRAETVLPQEGEGCCCNYIVYDPGARPKQTVHFFSRIVGAGEFCQVTQPSRVK